MKKQTLRRNAKNTQVASVVTIGQVKLDLCIWCFDEDEYLISHTADQLAKALHMSYNLDNFGVASFGLTEDSED